MPEDESENVPALQPSNDPVLRPRPLPETASPGFDWKVLWNGILGLISTGKKFGSQLEATTQTAADDALVGKLGLITAKVASGKAGEIRLPVRGGTQDYIACVPSGFADTLEINSAAEVVAFMPPSTVYVKPST